MRLGKKIDLERRITLVTDEHIHSGIIIFNKYLNSDSRDYSLVTLLNSPFMTNSKINGSKNFNINDIYLYDSLSYDLKTKEVIGSDNIKILNHDVIFAYENNNYFKNINREKYLYDENGKIKKSGKLSLQIYLKEYNISGFMHVEENKKLIISKFPNEFVALTNSLIEYKDEDYKIITNNNFFNVDLIQMPIKFNLKCKNDKILMKYRNHEIKKYQDLFRKDDGFVLVNGRYVNKFSFF